MSQAIVDPAELRRFAHNLKVFNGDVRGDLSSLHTTPRPRRHLGTRSTTGFVQEFEQTVAVLERF